jgi:hypothetical protein
MLFFDTAQFEGITKKLTEFSATLAAEEVIFTMSPAVGQCELLKRFLNIFCSNIYFKYHDLRRLIFSFLNW